VRTLTLGDRGPDVEAWKRAVHRYLNQGGLAALNRQPKAVRRLFGPFFQRHVKEAQQRLGLAAAMLGQPELLVLDEPTDGVDPVGRMEIRTLLAEERFSAPVAAEGLVAASAAGEAGALPPDFRFIHERMRDTHDLWHAVTGYQGDTLGEAALLAGCWPVDRLDGMRSPQYFRSTD